MHFGSYRRRKSRFSKSLTASSVVGVQSETIPNKEIVSQQDGLRNAEGFIQTQEQANK